MLWVIQRWKKMYFCVDCCSVVFQTRRLLLQAMLEEGPEWQVASLICRNFSCKSIIFCSCLLPFALHIAYLICDVILFFSPQLLLQFLAVQNLQSNLHTVSTFQHINPRCDYLSFVHWCPPLWDGKYSSGLKKLVFCFVVALAL